nr:early embryogenesis protein [Oryza sativa Japonica Group]
MADQHRGVIGGGGYGDRGGQEQQEKQPFMMTALKTVTAATARGSMLVLSGLILAGTVIALTVATPVLVIFSPVLVPARIALAVMAAGFVTSGGLGVAALSVFLWNVQVPHREAPPAPDQLDQPRRGCRPRPATSRTRRSSTASTSAGLLGRPAARRRFC